MHNRPVIGVALLLIATTLLGQGEIEKLPPTVNTPLYDESSPVISRDGLKLFFTRTADPNFESTIPNGKGQWTASPKDEHFQNQLSTIYSEIAGTTVVNPYSSSLNQDIWFSLISNDSVLTPLHPGYPINNALPNSLVSTGMTSDEYVLINEFHPDGSMYAGFSRVHIGEDGQTYPEPMYIYGFDIDHSDVNMTMTPNGLELILSINGPQSEGENDLYVSFYVRDNVWSTPIHIGAVLNTSYQETTPYLTPDKRFLYFSSDRPGGPGGNDIYRSERMDYTWLKWSKPELVKGEVNSAFDDSQPYFDPSARYMYFTSKRDGSSDIFRQHMFDKPRLKSPIVVKGKIINTKNNQLTRSEVYWGQLAAERYLEFFNSYSGEFIVTLTEYEPYKFQLRKPNHHAPRIMIDPRLIEQQGKDTVEIFFYLQPDELDSTITTTPDLNSPTGSKTSNPNASRYHVNFPMPANMSDSMELVLPESSFYDIYFAKSKAVFLSKSDNALFELKDAMNNNPNLELMIIGHTDNIGDGEALVELSNERADAVKMFLVRNGIAGSRIHTFGVGAADPIYENTTESNRERNRRVEIIVLKQ
jgi:outer membrane protein OmpA-like peptidoglycan-associated protein